MSHDNYYSSARITSVQLLFPFFPLPFSFLFSSTPLEVKATRSCSGKDCPLGCNQSFVTCRNRKMNLGQKDDCWSLLPIRLQHSFIHGCSCWILTANYQSIIWCSTFVQNKALKRKSAELEITEAGWREQKIKREALEIIMTGTQK